jgi:hypothetical protein
MSNAPLRVLIVLTLLACAGLAPAEAGVRAGAETMVSLHGMFPSLAVDGREKGNFVLVWVEAETPASQGLGVFGRIISGDGPGDGGSIGPRFQVNTRTVGNQDFPKVAAGRNGSFVVAWQGGSESELNPPAGDGQGTGIFARRFSAAGVPQGSDLRASSSAEGNQIEPYVAVGEQGDFLVARRDVVDGLDSIVVARFSAAGSPLGDRVMKSTPLAFPDSPRLARSPQGYAAGWTDYVHCGNVEPDVSRGVVALFDGAGRRVARFAVTDPCAASSNLAFLVGSRAGFLAVFGLDRGGYVAQRFAPTGEQVGGRFKLPGQPLCLQCPAGRSLEAVAMDDRGRLAVVWEELKEGGYQLSAQVFSPRGRPLEKSFRVSETASNVRELPAVAFQNDGSLLVAWGRESETPGKTGLVLRGFQID